MKTSGGTALALDVIRARQHEVPGRPFVHHCETCGGATRGGKAYCSAHVDMMPYAHQLLERMALAVARAKAKRKARRLAVAS